MRTTRIAIAGIVFAVTMALLSVQPTQVWAGESPTPSPSEVRSGVPASPTALQLNLGDRVITWVDNSIDELGFRVTFEIAVGSQVVHSETQTVSANVTSAQISAAAPIVAGDAYNVAVVAFNDAGESPPARDSRPNEGHLVLPTPTLTARATSVPVGLPETGFGAGMAVCPGLCRAAASLAFGAAGLTLIALGRAHSRRDM